MDAVGPRIRRLRTQLGMSQDTLAAGICSKAFISQLERGRVRASLRTLSQLADRLGVAVTDLLGPGEPTAPLYWMTTTLRQILDALDAGDQDEAKRRTLLALGQVCEQMGDKDAALEAYRRAADVVEPTKRPS